MRNRKNNKKVIVLVVILLLLSISIGYAYLTKILKINNTANIAKTTWNVHFENVVVSEGSVEGTPIIDETKTTVSLSVSFVEPGDFFEYTVDVVNGGSIDAMVSLLPDNLTEEQAKYLEYTVIYYDDIEINPYDQLLAGEKDKIKVRISLKDEGIPENLYFTIETTINYAQKDKNGKERESTTLKYLMKKVAVDDTSINFGAISSDTNGKGIYHLTKIKTSEPIYYYRGEVDNNVIFGGFCWKIIRTTETGGVKLIYNGEPNNSICDATGDATEIGKSNYSSKPTSVSYHSTTIKTEIDTWFENNLLDYQDYLEDTPFYNEKDEINKTGNGWTYPSAYRVWQNDPAQFTYIPDTTIKLGATTVSDIYTVSSELGNGLLTYPVGLITSDEVIMAGGRGWTRSNDGANTTYYLHSNSYFWTISPYNHIISSIRMIVVYANGSFEAASIYYNTNGIRPVISLNAETVYLRGEGTKEKPYIITE